MATTRRPYHGQHLRRGTRLRHTFALHLPLGRPLPKGITTRISTGSRHTTSGIRHQRPPGAPQTPDGAEQRGW